MLRLRINSILALMLVLSLNETGCQHFGPRDAGYITRYLLHPSVPARKTREMDSNAATNHEAYSEKLENDIVDESLRVLERAGRGMQNRHISLVSDEDEVVDLESLPGEELKLTRLACNYSKQNSRADSTKENLPSEEKITGIETERPLEGGHMAKAKEALEKKWTREALSRNNIPIRRGDAVNYSIVTVYPKSRLTMENLMKFGIATVVVLFLFINISRLGQEMLKNHEKLCTSQHLTRLKKRPTGKPTPPSEETELQKLTRPCGECRTLTVVIEELLEYLSNSKVILSNLEKRIQSSLKLISVRSSRQRHGESSPPEKTRENTESPEDKSKSLEEEDLNNDWTHDLPHLF